jgi:hypothetical protein
VYICIAQGVSSKYIRYDPRTESYIIDPSLKLPTSVRDSVLSLCELGWLYSKVIAYCNASEGLSISKGLIVQAFGYSLQEELHDYYRLLAILEQELGKSNNNLGRPATNSSDTSVDDDDSLTVIENKNHRLSIMRLRTWLQEPIDRFLICDCICLTIIMIAIKSVVVIAECVCWRNWWMRWVRLQVVRWRLD